MSLLVVAVAAGTAGYLGGLARAAKSGSLPIESSHRSPPKPAVVLDTSAVRPNLAAEAALDDDAWSSLSVAPWSRSRDAAMCAAIRRLATSDPKRAIARWSEEPNRMLRAELAEALLQGWAKVDPEAAVEWALTLSATERREAMSTLFQCVAEQPEMAVRLAATVCDRDAAHAGAYGHALTLALSKVGAFEAAVRFAEERPALSAELLSPAYYEWAQRAPEAALAYLARSEHGPRDDAFRGVMQGWSMANPGAVADYARNLEGPGQRAVALEEALPRWVECDAAAAGAWLEQARSLPECDSGRAALAMSPALLSRQPQAAARWACAIRNDALREDTVSAVVREWSRNDPANARAFVAADPGLSAAQRGTLLAELAAQP